MSRDRYAEDIIASPKKERLPFVILGSVALLGKLTGIGHYTRQLIMAIRQNELVADLKMWGDVGFLRSGVLDRLEHEFDSPNRSENPKASLKTTFRQSASRSYLATLLYSAVTERVAAHRLAPLAKDHVYHSPNYILPRFEGPKVITIHDLSVIRFPQFHRKQMVKICEQGIRRAIDEQAQMIVDSDLVGRELIGDFGVSEERITTVHLAPDERCRPRSEVECRETLDRSGLKYKTFFLSVGTIEPRKNLLRLFEAYRAGRQAGLFDWPLVVVGAPGWKLEREYEALRELCADGFALYLGYVSDAELHMLYSSAGALVFPSLYEGFGLPVADALASGCRVITSEQTAMAEFADGHAALVDPLDCRSIMKAMHSASKADTTFAPVAVGRQWCDVAEETVAVYSQA